MVEIKKKTPEQLVEAMGIAAYEFAAAHKAMKKIAKQKLYAEAHTAVILVAKRHDLLKNKTLAEHFKECLKDPKFRLTNELIKSFSYLENQTLFEEYSHQEEIAKAAEKEHAMWTSQLMWYQSENKLKGSELLSKL